MYKSENNFIDYQDAQARMLKFFAVLLTILKIPT